MVARRSSSGYIDCSRPGGCTGGGAPDAGTVELAEKILGMPVRIGLPRNIGGLNDTVQSPIYSTAVGLVLYASKRHSDLHREEKSVTLKRSLVDMWKRLRS